MEFPTIQNGGVADSSASDLTSENNSSLKSLATTFDWNDTSLLNNDTTLLINNTIYNNDTEVFYIPYHLRPETYIVPVVLGFIFVVGVVGEEMISCSTIIIITKMLIL